MDVLSDIGGVYQLFLSVFKDRFFDKILDNRTKDLLNKVELLD